MTYNGIVWLLLPPIIMTKRKQEVETTDTTTDVKHATPLDAFTELQAAELDFEERLENLEKETLPEKQRLNSQKQELQSELRRVHDHIKNVTEALEQASTETWISDSQITDGVPRFRLAENDEMDEYKAPHQKEISKAEEKKSDLDQQISDVPKQIAALTHPVAAPLKEIREHLEELHNAIPRETKEKLHKENISKLAKEFEELYQAWLNQIVEPDEKDRRAHRQYEEDIDDMKTIHNDVAAIAKGEDIAWRMSSPLKDEREVREAIRKLRRDMEKQDEKK